MHCFKQIVISLIVLLSVSTGLAIELPDFMLRIPPGHFAGVSVPCDNFRKAKESAVADVAAQILGCINAKYNHIYQSTFSGSPQSPQMKISDDLQKTASGIILDIEKQIVRSLYSRNSFEKHVIFILVKYPDAKIQEMRRLSKGSRLSVSVESISGSQAQIKVTESNGVSVTLGAIKGTIHKTYSFARFYNFCIWKVPYESQHSFSIAVGPISVYENSIMLELNIRQLGKDWTDWLLGASTAVTFEIKGFDEIGRPVRAFCKY